MFLDQESIHHALRCPIDVINASSNLTYGSGLLYGLCIESFFIKLSLGPKSVGHQPASGAWLVGMLPVSRQVTMDDKTFPAPLQAYNPEAHDYSFKDKTANSTIGAINRRRPIIVKTRAKPSRPSP